MKNIQIAVLLLLLAALLCACGAKTEKIPAGQCTFSISCQTLSDAPEKFKIPASGKPVPRIVSPYDVPSIYDVVFGKCQAD